MKIQRISTNGFRGLPDRSFELVEGRGGRPFDLVLVTGPAGSGKTSFLDAIIAAKEDVGAYGPRRSAAELVRPGEAGAKVRLSWVLGADERARAGGSAAEIATESIFSAAFGPSPDHDAGLAAVLGEYDRDPAVGKVEYFHASRRMPQAWGARAIAAGAIPSVDRGLRLSRDDAKFAGLVELAVQVLLGLDEADPNARDDRRGAERLSSAFASLCRSGKRLDGVQRAGGAIEPRFVDATGLRSGLAELSDGERQAFLFAATFLRSGINGSLVLIDTPELHLGGPDAAAFLAAVARLGVDNQLVVATASAEIIAAAPPAQVIRLDAGRA
jgi:predicted ATPase